MAASSGLQLLDLQERIAGLAEVPILAWSWAFCALLMTAALSPFLLGGFRGLERVLGRGSTRRSWPWLP